MHAELDDMYPQNISFSTIDRFSYQMQYRIWLAKNKPKLEETYRF
jgi:hypothetical protein